MAADLLSRVLDLDRAKLYERIDGAKLRGSGFLWIKRKVDAGRSRAAAQPEAGLGRISARDAAVLSASGTGRARGRIDRAWWTTTMTERGNAGIESSV